METNKEITKIFFMSSTLCLVKAGDHRVANKPRVGLHCFWSQVNKRSITGQNSANYEKSC